MLKKLIQLLLICLALLFSGGVLAENGLELVAPGGGEVDLQGDVMKYYAAGSDLVVVRWGIFTLETKLLEYQRDKAVLKGSGMAKLTQKEPRRTLVSDQIFADLNQERFIANGAVKLKYDEITDISGERLDWEHQTEWFELEKNVTINYSGWKMTGEKVEGDLNSGMFTVYGPVQAVNKEDCMRAGRVIFDRASEKVTLLENPVVINGKNELAATEIVYDLKTKKISAIGLVKSRMIE